ncbi:hypothetical protein BRD56_01165 [Thermoplasmatales archaeon SW_10_69_26]|nr:MAG: hypothetical protein BRD56_01165 [Thermoplasmatales archaeon SW_10_69_26]
MQVGQAPLPTAGNHVHLDPADPVGTERTVATFEVPDHDDRFYLHVTEVQTNGAAVEFSDRITAVSPDGNRSEVGGYTPNGNFVAVWACYDPPAPFCSDERHPGLDPPHVTEAGDGEYELRFVGLTSLSYTVSVYGFVDG